MALQLPRPEAQCPCAGGHGRGESAHAQTFGDNAAAEGAQQEGLAPAATGADHAATRNTVGATTFPSPFPAIRLSPPVPGQRLPGTRSPHCLANQFFVFFSDYWKPRSRGCLVGVGDKREGTDRRPSHSDHAGSKPSRLEGVRSPPGPMAQEFSRAERAASWYVRCHAVRNEVRCGQAARRPFPRVGLAPFTCARTRDQPAPASHAGPSEGPPAGAELTWKERPSLSLCFLA